MQKKTLSGSVQNTVQKTGIFVISLAFLSFVLPVWLNGKSARFVRDSRVPEFQSRENANHRKFEIQFHSNQINSQLTDQALNEAGVDKVLVRVFQDQEDSGGLFFSNSEFEVIDPVFNRLAAGFPGNGVALYAWMISRRFSWVKNSYFFDFQIEKNSRTMIRKFDLFNPDAIAKIVSVYRELARMKIQGILIQDDLFIRYNEGFSNWGKAAFTIQTNLPVREDLMMNPASEYGQRWTEIKVNQINKVLSMIVKACKETSPSIEIGMNVHYETPYFIERSKLWYAHQLTGLVKTGIDYIYLMTYHRQMKKEMRLSESENQILFKKILENASRICGPRLIAKLQIRDWETGNLIPVLELKTYLELVPGNVRRVCLTPVRENDLDFIRKLVKEQGRMQGPDPGSGRSAGQE